MYYTNGNYAAFSKARKATEIMLLTPDGNGNIPIGDSDLVFVTLGCNTENSAYGDPAHSNW